MLKCNFQIPLSEGNQKESRAKIFTQVSVKLP